MITFFNTKMVDSKNSFENMGNFLLSPSQYLFEGKKYKHIDAKQLERSRSFPNEEKTFLKTALAVIVFIPSTILGALFKTVSYLSSTARLHHRQISLYTKPAVQAASLNPAPPLSQLFTGPLGGVYNANYLEALNANQPLQLTQKTINKKGDARNWNQVRDNYNAFCNRLKENKKVSQPIEKTVHLIWLGSAPNKEVKDVRDSWEKHHPKDSGWTVKLWGDKEVEALIAEKRKKYPQVGVTWDAATKWAEKADIARYCILEEEGGVYADSDLPCYGKVDDLHAYSDFYAGLEMNDHGAGILYVGNALIGARKGHPLIVGCLENLKPRKPGEDGWAIIGRTGPGLITDRVYAGLREDQKSKTFNTLIMPPAYFYPLHSGDRHEAAVDSEFAKSKVLPYSKGLHLWNLSWG